MYVFGEIDRSTTIIESNLSNYSQNLTTASVGIQTIQIASGSNNNKYWQSLNVLFYTSGSSTYGSERKFASLSKNLSIQQRVGEQHLNKFHGLPSSSLITIPQQYYGEKIKESTFIFKGVTKTIEIRDDGKGNLYPVNNNISHSATPQSSSTNYVGNIFYDKGLIILTETSSYSHTPSTATITVTNQSTTAGINHFFVTSSDLSTSIKFISTGSYASETDSSTIKYFGSGSDTRNTAVSGARKVNDVFDGAHISASSSGDELILTNNANLLDNRRPTTTAANLPPISGSGGFSTGSGFSGGVAAVNYTDTDVVTNYSMSFDSVNTITTHEYNVNLLPQEYNHSTNYTLRATLSGSGKTMDTSTPYMGNQYTGSEFQPYISEIHLYSYGDFENPIIKAALPRPIRKSDKINLRFKIKLDI